MLKSTYNGNFMKKVISLASVRISHTSLGTPIINPERSLVAKVTKINVFIFGICDFYAALAYIMTLYQRCLLMFWSARQQILSSCYNFSIDETVRKGCVTLF